MPVQKFRSAEDAALAMIQDPDSASAPRLRRFFFWAQAMMQICPAKPPTFHGLRKFRSIEEAAADRELAEREALIGTGK